MLIPNSTILYGTLDIQLYLPPLSSQCASFNPSPLTAVLISKEKAAGSFSSGSYKESPDVYAHSA